MLFHLQSESLGLTCFFPQLLIHPDPKQLLRPVRNCLGHLIPWLLAMVFSEYPSRGWSLKSVRRFPSFVKVLPTPDLQRQLNLGDILVISWWYLGDILVILMNVHTHFGHTHPECEICVIVFHTHRGLSWKIRWVRNRLSWSLLGFLETERVDILTHFGIKLINTNNQCNSVILILYIYI